MEIRNNLISRIDINSISKSKKVHQLKRQQYQPYKVIADAIDKPDDPEVTQGFINTVTNSKFTLDDFDLLTLVDSTSAYHIEQTTNTPGKNIQVFIPMVEIVNSMSNPKLIFTFKNGIKHAGGSEYNVVCSINNIQNVAYTFFDIVRSTLNYPNKKKLTMVIYVKPGRDRLAVFKMQVLDVLVTKQANYNMAKMLKDQIRNTNIDMYIEKYNDWYFSSSDPTDKKWTNYVVYINAMDESFSIGTNEIEWSTFATSQTKLPLVLSVNKYEECPYSKKEWASKYDKEEYIEEDDNSEKIQLFIDYPKARYYDIVLSNLPEEYKTDEKLWKELIKSSKHTNFKVLFKDFSTKFADRFEDEWKSKNNVERVPMGYYHQICMQNKKFVSELYSFLSDYIETLLYTTDFTILDKDAAEIIRMMTYGRFYYSPDDKNSTWWYFVYDNMDSALGEVCKWKKEKDLSLITMSMIHNDYYTLVDKVCKKIEVTMEKAKSKDKVMTKIKSYTRSIGNALYPGKVNKILPSLNQLPWLANRMDAYPDIIGVYNGIVNIGVAPGKILSPEPEFISGYSKYFISKSARANYRPFNKNDPACKIWLDLLRDTTPEKDAREVKWYIYSTGVDQSCSITPMFQIVGGGANGKSAESDNIMYTLGSDYAVKLRSDLLMGKSKPGQADNDLMQMKGKNIGFICETDQNDILIASRLKTLNEYIKTGRKNYGDPENFQTNCTVVTSTNYALNIQDTDYGTFRRTIIYHQPNKYVEKPNPKYPNERKADRRFEKLAMNNPEMADGLLACLIHKRIKFHHKYNSELEKVPMPTIEKYTKQYRIEQNGIMGFLSIKLVLLYGYDKSGEIRDDTTLTDIQKYYMSNNITFEDTISLDDIIKEYREWYKNIGPLDRKTEILKREFRDSMLGKYLKTHDDGKIFELSGYRILQSGKRKLKEEEYFM